MIFCYRKRIWELVKKPFNQTNICLIIATLPTVAMVLIFHNFLEDNFSSHVLVWGFFASALLLAIAGFKSAGT